MIGIVDWAAARARMVIAFILLSLMAGGLAYVSLPKEGEPDIEIPALFVSVPFPGISAEDSEKLLVKPMETELSDLDGLKKLSGTASENYAGVAMEFEFGWDKTKILADVRDRMNTVEAKFPAGAEKYTISEINFSEFPIIIVNLTGNLPERTLLRVAKDLQDRLEGLEPVLEAGLSGDRDEMLEVVIDPLRLEAYNVTANELIGVVQNNNLLIAADKVTSDQGAFAVKIPSSFDDQQDIYALPIKTEGDRVVTLGELADIRLTFEDRQGTARFNGEKTVALQVVKRKGFNLIDTAALVREEVEKAQADWPEDLRQAIRVGTSNDQSRQVKSMVQQLEGSVLTAVALVMIVVLGSLGIRSALLVGFAIPTSFLLCFLLLGMMGITISNIVMFGLILAVGMLVDGAIVVVEYADKRIEEGAGPMTAFVEAAKRMFWPIVSSTATTLCAFLPMLFWPGVPGEFMGMLPVTLIFVLSASLVVALVYLPVMGGVAGRMSRMFGNTSDGLRRLLPWWFVRAVLVVPSALLVFVAAMQMLNPDYLFPAGNPLPPALRILPGGLLFIAGCILTTITLGAVAIHRTPRRIRAGRRRTLFGWFTKAIAGNPVMPLVAIAAVVGFVVATFGYFGQHNNGVEFFVESEPEQAIVYVRARGNLSLAEKDAILREVEDVVLTTKGIDSAFAFAGAGGLNSNTGGAQGPLDAIGQVQIELIPWDDRPAYARSHPEEVTLAELDGDAVLADLQARLDKIPGIRTEILNLAQGPAQGKPVHLRLKGDDFAALQEAAATARAKFEATEGLTDIEDTRPLPGIDWQIDVDVEKAGRYGADVQTVGGMVQLVTRGILLDTMRVPSSDEEIEIRVRLPEEDRVLSTLDTLKVRTNEGLVPLSNFITRKPVPKLGQIDRVDQQRYFDVKADVTAGLTKEGPGGAEVPINANERIETLTEWLEDDRPLPPGVTWEWTGDQEEQAESGAFLMKAFAGALGLMFIILLAQFNSFYNAVLVLLAVVLSTAGCLIGMLVMGQPFSIIMTGTGIVALAGIVVNNNIVLIDTFQEYSQYMPKIEAIVRTAEDRIRPVLLTTITTMAGLAPMMFGLSLDFIGGGYSIDSPTALWWKQLATAVVFGLGIATVLTLIFTPAMLALRIWLSAGAYRSLAALKSLSSRSVRRDLATNRAARKVRSPEILWETGDADGAERPDGSADDPAQHLRAAE
ncbi:efflux RND transporter permease subunit [Oceaniglobus roseus]|uniref:efflux RND transporter permease subunit n=1 Tax=Oceaniglobus roseus TaxID=1737570 RepID=UPI000C7EB556|nr:efflux RND transporter permease subunit [Kandeliimicrobium roseum]